MLDPVTILSAANTLISISSKLFNEISSLIGKYQGADILLTNLSTQCSVANSGFARIQSLLQNERGYFACREGEEIDFALTMENALLGAFRIFSALDNEIAKMKGGSAHTVSRMARLRTSYNEGALRERSRQLQDCCSSIHFLLTVVTMYLSLLLTWDLLIEIGDTLLTHFVTALKRTISSFEELRRKLSNLVLIRLYMRRRKPRGCATMTLSVLSDTIKR